MAADEKTLPPFEQELERSRESASRLLDALAQKLRVKRAAENAAYRVQRAAHYVQSISVKDMAAGMERWVRQSPGRSLAIAAVAGFLVGRALRSR